MDTAHTQTKCPLCEGKPCAGRDCTGKVIIGSCRACRGTGELSSEQVAVIAAEATATLAELRDDIAWMTAAGRHNDAAHYAIGVRREAKILARCGVSA